MHWTAFLAYRRFPANARVVDDLACIQCGHNLRTLMVAARCPECGYEVGNSIFLLSRPDVTARGLRGAGMSYLAPLTMILPLLHPTYWTLLIAAGASVLAGVSRLVGVGELRFRAAIARLPVLGPRVRWWWLAALIDLGLAIAWCAAVIIIAGIPTIQGPATRSVLIWITVAWWFQLMLSALAAGRFAFALVDMLGYVWTRVEFRVQQALALAALAFAPVLLLGLTAVASPGMALLIEGSAFLLTALLALATAIPLLHSATAAEESAETWDDVIESERVVLVPEASLPRRPEPPPIPIDGG